MSRTVLIEYPYLPDDALCSNQFARGMSPKAKEYRRALTRQIRADGAEYGLFAKHEYGVTEPLDKIAMTITFCSPRANRDVQNLLQGLKGWIDGLQDTGLIKNDNAAHLQEITLRWERGNEATKVEIREIE